jgi:DNA-binding PadR family transcriptional regulator
MDPQLLILASLAGGPKHGYAVMEDVRLSCGVRIGPGTLYTALARLEKRGLVEPLASEDRRRPYRLTAQGEAALREELRSLQRVLATGLDRLASA